MQPYLHRLASSSKPPRTSGAAAASLVVLLAVLTRALESIQQTSLFNDGPRFIAMAQAFAAGDWRAAIADSFHPLTALCMAGVSLTSGLSFETSALIVSVLAGGVGAWAIWAATRDAFGSRLALAAGVVFALHPRLVESSAGVQSDGLHVAWFMVGTWAMARSLRGATPIYAVIAGAACGLAYLTRPEGLAIALIFGAWWSIDVLRRRTDPIPAIGRMACFAIMLFLVGGPYVAALHATTGHWSLTTKKSLPGFLEISGQTDEIENEVSLDPRLDSLQRQQQPPRAMEAGIVRVSVGEAVPSELSPAAPAPSLPSGALASAHSFASRMGEIAYDGLRALQTPALLLIAIGFIAAPPSRTTRITLSFVALFLLLLFALHLHSGYVSRRHWLPVVALLSPYVARGGLRALDGLPRIPWIGTWRHARVAVVASVVIASLAHAAVPQEDPHKVARRNAALWLAKTTDAPVIASHRSRDAYLAGASDHVPLIPSVGGLAAMLGQARAEGAEYALLDADRVESATALPPWAHELHRSSHRGRVVLVLRLDPELRARAQAP